MHQSLASREIKALEKKYLKEIEILKFKLLSGAILKDIAKQKNKAVELALLLHGKQCNTAIDSSPFLFEEV